MASMTAERNVARRNDIAVKIDTEVARLAKIVAAYKDVSLAEYISDTLRPIVEAHLREHSRKSLEDTPKPEVKPKPKAK
jgi:hypothetical protein